jgi:3',5'-cyclic AMP phosphodiesterase CpdA
MATIAITADLHWGVRAEGDAATRRLIGDLLADPVDVLVLAGDIGAGDDFARCLERFSGVGGRKALIPGNHDIWVEPDDARGDSWRVYSEWLPELSRQAGFHFLDHEPLLFPELELAMVGSMNWYDFSWGEVAGWEPPPDWAQRLREMRFTRGRHNDGRFVRWPFSHQEFTAKVVAVLARQLDEVLGQMRQAIVVTHHPAFAGLNFPDPGPPTLDRMLWRAFSGNQALEEVLARHAARIPLVFSGHTHRARENQLGTIRGVNIGGDYDWKRLIRLTWPEGTLEVREFRASP